MTEDARFEDGVEAPLRLKAQDSDDLAVLSSLVQDAIFPGNQASWQQSQHRFAILLNRFRWEDNARQRHGPERVQTMLIIEDVLAVQSTGVTRDDEVILSLLSIEFEPGNDGTGALTLTLAGDGVGMALAGYSADEARAIKGLHSGEIETALGHPGRTAMIHRDDMVLWD